MLLLLDTFSCYLHTLYSNKRGTYLVEQLLEYLSTHLYQIMHRKKTQLMNKPGLEGQVVLLQDLAKILRRQVGIGNGKKMGQLCIEID